MPTIITALGVGILIGVIISGVIFRRYKVGTLCVDTSDPYDDPYLFLELDASIGDISLKHYVILKVDIRSYLLPRN